MAQKKITEQLSLHNLEKQFFIGEVVVKGKLVKVNALQDAIKDGTLLVMVQEAADTLNGGDIHAVYAQLSRNLSSWLCNAKKASYWPHKDIDMIRYNLLKDFVTEGLKKCKVESTGNSKSYWQWSLDEIKAIDDYKTAKSVYDNIASYKQKKLDRELQSELYADATMRQKAARTKMNELKPVEDTELAAAIDKFQKGETLTQEEAALLLKALKK